MLPTRCSLLFASYCSCFFVLTSCCFILKVILCLTLILVIRHGKASFLNLAIISFVGLYYHISKRAAGIRYVFIGKASNQRPRYHVLKLYKIFLKSMMGHQLGNFLSHLSRITWFLLVRRRRKHVEDKSSKGYISSISK